MSANTKHPNWLLLGGQQSGRFVSSGDRYTIPRFLRRRPIDTSPLPVAPHAVDLSVEIDEYDPHRVQAWGLHLADNSSLQPEPIFVGVLKGLDFNDRLARAATALRTLEQLELYFGKEYFDDIVRRAKRDFPL